MVDGRREVHDDARERVLVRRAAGLERAVGHTPERRGELAPGDEQLVHVTLALGLARVAHWSSFP